MGVCIFGMGDCSSESSVEQVFKMDVLTKKIFKQTTTNIQECNASGVNIQDMSISVVNAFKGCPIKASQSVSSSVECESEFNPETIIDMKDEIANDLKQAAATEIEAKTEMFATASSKTDISTTIDVEIQNIVDTQITTENINKVAAESINIQDGKIQIVNCYDSIDFEQSISAQVVAKAVTKSLTKAIQDSKVINDVVNDLKSSAKSSSGGLAGLIDSLANMFTGPMKYAIIASVICVCVIMLAVTLFLLSPAGQNSTRTIANAGAKKLGGPF